MRTSIDPTTLRELLRYDAGDGVLYWRERDSKFFQPTEKREASGHAKWWNGRFAGKRACKSDCNRGYLRVCLFGDEYPAHRVIWAMETGQWPTNVIDHIDGDPANNRIANLRSATTAENNRNKANHGQSRFRGVSWRARQSIWVSAIKTNKKVTFLGCYKDEEDAARAYDVAAIEQHGNFARTNFPRADYEARIKSALITAPPADAGMREAFVRVLASLAAASPGDASRMREALVEARQRLALFARPDSEYEKPTFDLIDAALAPAAKAGGDASIHRIVLDLLNDAAPAVENLACHQEQADMDGTTVKVSRQALDEVLSAINEVAIQSALAATPTSPSADVERYSNDQIKDAIGFIDFDPALSTDAEIRQFRDALQQLIQSAANGGATKSDGSAE